MTAADIITPARSSTPHLSEGGHFPALDLGDAAPKRTDAPPGQLIYFLAREEETSRWHPGRCRTNAAITNYARAAADLVMRRVRRQTATEHVAGPDLAAWRAPAARVPAGHCSGAPPTEIWNSWWAVRLAGVPVRGFSSWAPPAFRYPS